MRSHPAHHLVRRALSWDLQPVDVLRLVRDDVHPVALVGAWAGGGAVISSEPVLVRSPPDSLGEVLDSPFPAAVRTSEDLACGPPVPEPASGTTDAAFGGGWMGYLGYGAADGLLDVPPAPGDPRRLPAWWFGYYDHVLRRDGGSGRWFFEALWTAGREEALEHRFGELSRRSRSPGARSRGYSCGDFVPVPSAAEHREAVRRAIGLIWAGDIFQANICLRLEAGFHGDPVDLFCRGVTRLRPPFAAFLRLPHGAMASFSPELFLCRTGRTVLSRPIKGTHRRSAAGHRAAAQRRELESSAKDRAENVMIVDLMRNDLSRACVAGSVKVPRLLHAEAHPGVWHLASDVRGTLNPGSGDGALVSAAFPPGSVTGAPKVRALEIIHELEATPREIYTGAAGYRSPVAGLELNVAIRTFEFCADRVWLGAGGGIVADSLDDEEYRECLLKAGPLIRAVGAQLSSEAGSHADEAPSRVNAVRSGMRPRPASGVFTSLLVTAGTTRDLASHLTRLEASARKLFGKHLPSSLHDDLAACLARHPSGRLRITARPVGGPLQADVAVVPLDDRPVAVGLQPAVIARGLGPHKWLDRRLVAEIARQKMLGADEQLLIQDRDGAVLETDRANIFAVVAGTLRTPPSDGRILPGVTRAAALRIAHLQGVTVDVAPMTRAQLAAASEVFVTSAACGVLPVKSIAGRRVTSVAGPVTRRIAARLAERSASDGHTAPAGHAPGWPAATMSSSGGPVKPAIILIDNYDSFTYNLAHMLLINGCLVEVVRNDEVPAEQVAAFRPAGVVISPGPCAPADAGISTEVVRACGGTTPLLGICLGHQVIAAAFGARIIRAPRPVHGQTSVIVHDSQGIFTGLPQRFEAARYHSLMVEEDSLPACLTVTARTRERIPMALRHVTHPIEGVQFHPESILTEHGATIMHNFIKVIGRHRPTGRGSDHISHQLHAQGARLTTHSPMTGQEPLGNR